MVNNSYQQLSTLSPGKPVLIAEMGTDLMNAKTNQSEWISDALYSLSNSTWPGIVGVIWWNSAWSNNTDPHDNTTMRVEDFPKIKALFRTIIGSDKRFLSTVSFNCTMIQK